jgi:peptidoglycan/xylan/chitin deacetylase (PgdA/CDA1 family)
VKRWLKLAMLHVAASLGVFHVARALTRSGIRVLCYHGIWMGERDWRGDSLFIAQKSFAERLATIRRLEYPVISLSEAVDVVAGKRTAPPAAVVITIDDGWYSTYHGMLSALERERMPATLYCDTAQLQWGQAIPDIMARYIWRRGGPAPEGTPAHDAFLRAVAMASPPESRLAAAQELAQHLSVDISGYLADRVFHYMMPEELRDLHARGIDVQLHTHNHTLHDLSQPSIAKEIEVNRQVLSSLLDLPPDHFRHFCYPKGVRSPAAESALERLGLDSSTTTSPGLAFSGTPPQAIPRFLDGEQVSAVEFEAELSGFSYLMRSLVAKVRRTPSALLRGQPMPERSH